MIFITSGIVTGDRLSKNVPLCGLSRENRSPAMLVKRAAIEVPMSIILLWKNLATVLQNNRASSAVRNRRLPLVCNKSFTIRHRPRLSSDWVILSLKYFFLLSVIRRFVERQVCDIRREYSHLPFVSSDAQVDGGVSWPHELPWRAKDSVSDRKVSSWLWMEPPRLEPQSQLVALGWHIHLLLKLDS